MGESTQMKKVGKTEFSETMKSGLADFML